MRLLEAVLKPETVSIMPKFISSLKGASKAGKIPERYAFNDA
jgi:hypothetical protein